MRLKRIEMLGFKSFADKTVVDFKEGITAVVGPNGSGKSNIADAVRWVLGEQSAKTLRGSKMGDVVFAGTKTRKPVGYCQVSLVFDNSDNWLKMAFNEVEVSRKYYKSGESDYFINKSSCRHKDILELFRDTGIGKQGYSIIGQGQVTYILSNNPDNRRTAFEAATGVLKYKTRRNEAKSRLTKTNDNLIRLNDILVEVEQNLNTLESQSKAAKEYMGFKEELKEKEVARFFIKHKDLNTKVQSHFDALNSIEQDVSQLEKLYSDTIETKQQEDKNYKDAITMLNLCKDEYAKFKEESAQFSLNKELSTQKLQMLNKDSERIEQSITDIEDKLQSFNLSLKEKEFNKTEKDNEIVVLRSKEETLKKRIELLKEDIENKTERLSEIKNNRLEMLNQKSAQNINASRLSTMEETIRARMLEVDNSLGGYNKRIDELKKEQEENQGFIDFESSKIDAIQSDKQKIKDRMENSKYSLDELLREKNQKDIEYSAIDSKIAMLKSMEKEYHGFSFSVKNLIKYCNDYGKNALHLGTVSDVIKVDTKYVLAVETALGGALQNIITKDEQDAKTLIEILKREKMGRATFLPLSSVKEQYLKDEELNSLSTITGVIDCAANLISYDRVYSPVIQKLLGRTVIVSNLESGIALMKKNKYRFNTVTLDGQIIYSGGAMAGGSSNKNKVGILSRKDEIAENLIIKENIGKKRQETQENILKAKEKIALFEKELEEIKFNLREKFESLSESKNYKNTVDVQYNEQCNAKEELIKEKEQLGDNLNDVLASLKRIDIAGKDGGEDVDFEKDIQDLTESLKACNQEYDNLNKENMDLSLKINDLSNGIKGLEKEIRTILQSLENLALEKEKQQTELLEISDLKQDVTLLLKESEHSFTLKAEKDGEYKEKIDLWQNNLDSAQSKRDEIEKSAIDIQEKLKNFMADKYKEKTSLDKFSLEMEMLTQEMFDKYDLTIEDVSLELDSNDRDEFNLNSLNKEIRKIKTALESLGNVNLNAIEEYAFTKSRHTELSAQMEDLKSSKTDLENLIEKLYKDMTKQFRDKFAFINSNFKNIFERLFNGGRAELILVDEENVMESDIEIIAEPPGKKLQSISLLSGGEKTLTAIAILFAMLELKPTPFCILDEIEAALDEANVVNFAGYLVNYSHNTQFVCITHRRGTMDNANTIYGVTMQEKGVSKIISIDTKGEN